MRTRDQIREAAVPFPDSLIEQVDGQDYVSWYHYTQRLLTQVGPYRWAVIEMQPDMDGGWVCHGRLGFDIDHMGESYDGIGTDEAYTDRNGKYHRGDPKAAESDAFKRACSKAGFGLHLWAGKHYWLEASLEKGTE